MNKLSFDSEPDNDENFFGNLRSRTNLGQLFGLESGSGNEPQTLKYQPTKQPLPQNATVSASDAVSIWSTQLAKVANAYKEGESVGKVGVALLSNAEGDCKVIAYKTKRNVLGTLSLPAAAAVTQLHRQSGYLQFYDDNNIYWSLRFDKETDEQEFLLKLQEKGMSVQLNVTAEEESIKEQHTQLDNVPDLVKEQPTSSNEVDKQANITRDTIKSTHAKSQLISRMAKMGQQLPRFNTTAEPTTEYSDSSDTEVIATPLSLGNKPAVVPRSNKLQAKAHIIAVKTATAAAPTTTVGVYNASNMSMGITTVNPMETQFLQMLLSENRTQNSEVRMNLGKLEGKIEKVLDKIDCLGESGSKQKANKEDELLELEEKLLNLKKANRKLKQALEDREQHNDGKLLNCILELYKNKLREIKVGPIDNFESLITALLEKHEQQHVELEKMKAKDEHCNQEFKAQERKLVEEQTNHATTHQQVNELELNIKDLQTKLLALQNQNVDLEEKITAQGNMYAAQIEQQQLDTADTVKAIMNSLYGNLVGQIVKLDKLRQDEVLSIIGHTIKEETLKAINTTKQ